METFRSTKQLAQVVRIFLIVNIINDILFVMLSVTELTLFPDLSIKEEELTNPELLITFSIIGVALISTIAFLGIVISFLMWLHRSYKNLKALDVSSLRSSPGWAVGSWFIPFVNLVVPLKIVNEVYHGSRPEQFENEIVLSDNSTTLLHGFWWATWLIANFLSNTSFRIFWNAETQSTIDLSTKIDLVSSLFWIVSGYLLFEIVGKITEWQEESGSRLRISEPPQPPVFN